jgi:hypothetical protein
VVLDAYAQFIFLGSANGTTVACSAATPKRGETFAVRNVGQSKYLRMIRQAAIRQMAKSA